MEMTKARKITRTAEAVPKENALGLYVCTKTVIERPQDTLSGLDNGPSERRPSRIEVAISDLKLETLPRLEPFRTVQASGDLAWKASHHVVRDDHDPNGTRKTVEKHRSPEDADQLVLMHELIA